MKKPVSLALKGGSYSLAVTAVVLAILIVVNIFASTLPSSITKLDISSSKLYSITSNTKAVVNNLQQDVTIYWIVQADMEDSIIENLLSKYESLSDHIEVVKKNPDVFPTFTQSYTDETVPNNSLIVESGERYRYISVNDIYLSEDAYSYYATDFDGEGAITSAIDYVVTEDLPQLYVLQGHGEADLPATFADAIEKENIETVALSLLAVDEIPEDADALLIYAPQSDITTEEADMLTDYADNGGKLLVMAGPVEGAELTNLHSVLNHYGVTVTEGIVVENDRNYYAFGYPYVLMPDMASHAITDPLIEDRYYPIFPIAQGLDVSGATAEVTELLGTSSFSFSKVAGFELDTYEYEDGDIEGPFTLGVSIATENEGQIVWFSASDFLGDMYNAYSSGANVDLAMNAMSALMGEREAIAIRSKSLNYNYLTINESTASTLKFLMIGVFPLMYLAMGIFVIISKRKVQNEAV
ncbi:MAG: GldG family protein [Oscillospiraceae bacterium]|nr:GldG family protein [Oscillospiraceae bacterium]